MERTFVILTPREEDGVDYMLCVKEGDKTVGKLLYDTLHQALEAIGNYVEYNDVERTEIVIRKNESK